MVSRHALLTPRLLRIANEILDWTRTYLMKENPEMRRPYGNQKVCPFVHPSVESDHYYFAFHPNVGAVEPLIETIVLGYLDEFLLLEPYNPTQKGMKALIICFPDIPENDLNVLDLVQSRVKEVFVKSGLMLGQFHSKCQTRSVHNPAFAVSKCPHPLIAIRHMAVHDVLFLADARHAEWFNEYNLRFGERFKEPENLSEEDKPLLHSYIKAKALHLQ